MPHTACCMWGWWRERCHLGAGAAAASTLTATNNLVTALRAQGNLAGARVLLQQVLEGSWRWAGIPKVGSVANF